MTEDETIDFVVTWVDGADPNWLAERKQWAADDPNVKGRVAARFRDWGLFKYWFRAVETCAPWVRTVHFVTWGHVPPWLDMSHPKLHVVKHSDFIPAEYLPTFNSNVIEMFLHRIPGLSEKFVYFNDDVFLLRPVSPDYFFHQGLPRDFFCLNAIAFRSSTIGHTIGSTVAVINDNFRPQQAFRRHWRKFLSPRNGWMRAFKTLYLRLLFPKYFLNFSGRHSFMAFRRKTFEEVWAKSGEALAATCRNRFRGALDVNPWVFRYWQLVTGRFEPTRPDSFSCVHMTNDKRVTLACEALNGRQFDVLCVNDTPNLVHFDAAVKRVQAAFQKLFPAVSAFERSVQ